MTAVQTTMAWLDGRASIGTRTCQSSAARVAAATAGAGSSWQGYAVHGQYLALHRIILQMQGGKYHTVYPFESAMAEVLYPIPKWSERK